jgi:hypothetical protein
VYWTTQIEDDSVYVVFIPEIQAQLQSRHLADLSRRMHTLLFGKSPHESDEEEMNKIVKQWLDDQVARGVVVLPAKKEE